MSLVVFRERSGRPLWHSYEGAVRWLRNHRIPGEGVAVSDIDRTSYPEVTGYTIPTLLECGERQLAIDLARWLISIQRTDGGFNGPDHLGEPYLFDVGQALRGLIAVVDLVPEARSAVRRAADWMVASADSDGVLRPATDSPWRQQYPHINEDIHLYVLPPLVAAGELLNESSYRECAERSLRYYVAKPDLVKFRFLTHFYGYVLEALADLSRSDLARAGLEEIAAVQRTDGGIPAVPGASWICTPGTAQLAIVGYKVGLTSFADAALQYLQTLQMSSGGFKGSYGPGADYGPDAEPSWACKYFLDACHWKIRTTFAAQRDRFNRQPNAQDGRLDEVIDRIGDLAGKRMLDVGCGRGQFLRLLQERYPTADLWGLDIAPELLEDLPGGVQGKPGSMLDLPFPDASFDAVLCVEALEHAIRIERAVAEMCRVLKPGGRIVILDKDVSHLGLMPIESWEKWFDPQDLVGVLNRYCMNVVSRSVDVDRSGTRFEVAWSGDRSDVSISINDGNVEVKVPGQSETAPSLVDRYRREQRRAEARVLVNSGFASYQRGDLRSARRALGSALRRDPSWATNRGVLSVLAQSIVGPKLTRRYRTATAALRARYRGIVAGPK